MLMISPSSDSNLMTVYQHQVPTMAMPPSVAGAPNAQVMMASAVLSTQPPTGLTSIQPAPTPLPQGHNVYAAPTASVVPAGSAPFAQHATVLKTPMVQLVAQNGTAITLPAAAALAASAEESAAKQQQQQQQLQQYRAAPGAGTADPAAPATTPTKTKIQRTFKKPPAATVAPLKQTGPTVQTLPLAPPSPVDFVKKCFREWGVPIELTRDVTYFLKATPDRIAAYSRDLLTTVRQKDMPKLQRLHAEGKLQNACNPFGESLLHLACRKGLTEVVEFLCGQTDGPQLSLFVHDDYGRTVMHDACWTVRPQWPLVEFLLEHAPQLLACADVRGHIPLNYVPKDDWSVWMDFLVQRQGKIKQWILSAQQTTPSTPPLAPSAMAGPVLVPPAPPMPTGISVPQEVLDQQHHCQQKQQQHHHEQRREQHLKATHQTATLVAQSACPNEDAPRIMG